MRECWWCGRDTEQEWIVNNTTRYLCDMCAPHVLRELHRRKQIVTMERVVG